RPGPNRRPLHVAGHCRSLREFRRADRARRSGEPRPMSRLIIVSNRIPGKTPAAGGLAVALKKTLSTRDGFWFGWSGAFSENPGKKPRFETIDGMRIGSIDLTKPDHQAYYAGFSNSILWPAFHLRLDLTDIQSHWYEGYRRVNAQF